jgi:N,N'-diacetyllegionaminate synthase
MTYPNTIKIGDRLIGHDMPCFLVAEVGVNHNGDLNLARETIAAAVDAGADAVKFQNYRTEDFVTDKSLTYEYISEGKTVVESQYDMFKRFELTRNQLRDLKVYCDSLGVNFHSTPTSKSGIQDLVEIGTTILKNGSDYLTNLSLIRCMGESGLPTVLSTGMATLAEIDDAARTFRSTGNSQLVLLHCTSSYPTAPHEVNLRRIASLSSAFGCLVGFSDHTDGITSAVGAAALGACWIEKHFTLDKNLSGPDHRFSADPREFKNLVVAVRTIEQNLGQSQISPTPSEEKGRYEFRLSCVSRIALPAGHVLSESDICFQRPGKGIPPAHSYLLIGRRLNHDIAENCPIYSSDLQ